MSFYQPDPQRDLEVIFTESIGEIYALVSNDPHLKQVVSPEISNAFADASLVDDIEYLSLLFGEEISSEEFDYYLERANQLGFGLYLSFKDNEGKLKLVFNKDHLLRYPTDLVLLSENLSEFLASNLNNQVELGDLEDLRGPFATGFSSWEEVKVQFTSKEYDIKDLKAKLNGFERRVQLPNKKDIIWQGDRGAERLRTIILDSIISAKVLGKKIAPNESTMSQFIKGVQSLLIKAQPQKGEINPYYFLQYLAIQFLTFYLSRTVGISRLIINELDYDRMSKSLSELISILTTKNLPEFLSLITNTTQGLDEWFVDNAKILGSYFNGEA